MAVTFVATAEDEITSSGGTVAINCGSGDNRCLFIGLSFMPGSMSVTGVTYAGAACELHSGVSNGTFRRTEIWKKVNPASGSNNVAVSYTGTDAIIVGVTAFSGVDQTTPMSSVTSQATAGTNPSVSITITSGNFAHDVMVNNGGPIGSPSQTQCWADRGDTNPGGAGQRGNTSGAQTFSWTIGDSTDYVIQGCQINAAAAAGKATKNTRSFPLGIAAGMNRRM